MTKQNDTPSQDSFPSRRDFFQKSLLGMLTLPAAYGLATAHGKDNKIENASHIISNTLEKDTRVLTLENKLIALESSMRNRSHEEALGHQFDLMASVIAKLDPSVDFFADKGWNADFLVKLMGYYGKKPDPVCGMSLDTFLTSDRDSCEYIKDGKSYTLKWKISALKYCMTRDAEEDSIGHQFDLMAISVGQLPDTDKFSGKGWTPKFFAKLLEYNGSPIPVLQT